MNTFVQICQLIHSLFFSSFFFGWFLFCTSVLHEIFVIVETGFSFFKIFLFSFMLNVIV